MDESSPIFEESNHPQSSLDRRKAPGKFFTIKVGNVALEFQDVDFSDPMPTGRQMVEAAKFNPVEEFLLFAISDERRLTEIKLDETVDLRMRVKDHFLVFKSDRSWRGLIDGKRFEWGAKTIAGRVLKWLAGVDTVTHGVWLELRDEPDQLIGDEEQASLSPAGVERFRTDPLFHVCVEDVSHPWTRSTITTEEIAVLGGWDVSQGVVEVDSDQNERTLSPEEVIELRPNVSFGKKLHFKRGCYALADRI